MKVDELRAPKQLALTMRARMRAPTEPKTWDPNMTATVLELSILLRGRTRK